MTVTSKDHLVDSVREHLAYRAGAEEPIRESKRRRKRVNGVRQQNDREVYRAPANFLPGNLRFSPGAFKRTGFPGAQIESVMMRAPWGLTFSVAQFALE
jgi:hypothetical protein